MLSQTREKVGSGRELGRASGAPGGCNGWWDLREHYQNLCNAMPKLPCSTVQGAWQWQPWQQQQGKGKGNQARNQRTNEKRKALQKVCLPPLVGRSKVAEQKDPTVGGKAFCPGDLPLYFFGFTKVTHQGQDPIPPRTPSPSLCD